MGKIKAVVIIDMDITEVWLTTKMLNAINPSIKIIVALDGESGLKKVEQSDWGYPWLMLIDSSTQEIGCSEFIKRLKFLTELKGEIKIVVLVKREEFPCLEKQLKELDFIIYSKPLLLQDLMELVDS